MRILRYSWFLTVIMAVLVAVQPLCAGETIVYDGAAGMSQPLPKWWRWEVQTLDDNRVVSPSSSQSGNSVTVTGSNDALNDATYLFVTGGASETGDVSNNRLFLTGGSIYAGIGGYSCEGDVFDNSVHFSGSTTDKVQQIHGGWSAEGKATGNSVYVSSGAVGGRAAGGCSLYNDVSGNSVFISEETANNTWVNAACGGVSNSGTVSGNYAELSSGKIGSRISGGESEVGGDAIANRVSVTGGTIEGDRPDWGGGAIIGGYSVSSTARGNRVDMSGGKFDSANDSFIVGGLVMQYGASATGNIVTITGDARPATSTSIFGGYDRRKISDEPVLETGDMVTGNTLNIVDWRGKAKTIGNFETVNFTFSSAASAAAYSGDTPLLRLAENADFSNMAKNSYPDNNPNNIHTTVAINILGNDFLAPGTTFALIDKVENAERYANGTIYGQHGTLLEYEFDSALNGTALTATSRAVAGSPRAKVMTQSYLGGVAMLTYAGDAVVSEGISGLEASLSSHTNGWSRPALFSGASAGHNKAKTGSHIDLDSASFLAGLGVKNSSALGSLVMGAFFETGIGDYESTTSIPGRASSDGEGDMRYFGGGLLVRYALQNGLYADGSARIGRSKNNLKSSNISDIYGRQASYSISDTYYGAHFGLGYLWDLTACSTLDMSARYLWSYSGSHNLMINDDPTYLDSVNSHRLRAGARYSYAITEYATPYIGAFYEYEFDGKSNGTAYGVRLPGSELKGGTGVGELGLSCRVGRATVDFGARGFVGRRQGVSGTLRVGMTF